MLMALVSLHSWASIYLAIEGALVTHKGMIQGFLGLLSLFVFLIKTSIYGGIRGVTDSKRSWYKGFWPLGCLTFLRGFSLWGSEVCSWGSSKYLL